MVTMMMMVVIVMMMMVKIMFPCFLLCVERLELPT